MWNVENIPKMHECDWKHEGVVEAYNCVRQVMVDFAKEVEAMKKKQSISKKKEPLAPSSIVIVCLWFGRLMLFNHT